MNKYKIIYADPPWQYQKGNRKLNGIAKNHYTTMTTDDICKLKVDEISDDVSMLFLWATFRKMKEAFKVMDAWGFEYKTLGFSWTKLQQDGIKPSFGVGFYTRSNCEVCLIGTKGNAFSLVKQHNVSSCITTKRSQHSEKPEEARQRIVELVGDDPRIELFARKKAEGWDSWGDEIVSDIKL